MTNRAKRLLPLLLACALSGCEQLPPQGGAAPATSAGAGAALPPEYHAVPVALDPNRPQPTMDALSASRRQERTPADTRP